MEDVKPYTQSVFRDIDDRRNPGKSVDAAGHTTQEKDFSIPFRGN